MNNVILHINQVGLKQKNKLLIRDEIGRSKLVYRNLPSDDYVYGRDFGTDREHAKEGLYQNFNRFNKIISNYVMEFS